VTSASERDYFTDPSVQLDPYEYLEELYAKCPVHQMTSRDILMVTGFEESLEVLRNDRDFSSINTVPGAAYPLPFTTGGDDIDEEIRAHRHEIPGGDLLVSYDDAEHIEARALLNKLFVPSRLKANEEYMTRLADELARNAAARGGCEFKSEIATRFATLVIADLLGVPDADRDDFMRVLEIAPPAGNMESEERPTGFGPLEYMATFFVRYLEERRANPVGDILSELANATYPNGKTPDLMEVVRLSTFLFGAGQDTSANLLANCIRYIVDTPGLQEELRADRSLIPGLIEEVLRLEGSSKATFRVARRPIQLAGVEVPAGKRVMVALAAANRDPRRWPDPTAFELDRPKIKEHLAFGRGPHVCAGAPLARAEVRIMLEKILEHTSEIALDEQEHGLPGARRIAFEPSFIIRGVTKLNVVLKPRAEA
jgi:cytochrome P450